VWLAVLRGSAFILRGRAIQKGHTEDRSWAKASQDATRGSGEGGTLKVQFEAGHLITWRPWEEWELLCL
jgi:hypothetical protein